MPSTRSRREVDARRKRVGDVIKGRYKILSVIGKGGMSRVYLAADLQLTNKQWAVKEVDRNATDPTGRPIEQSLASEAELLSKLDHPNIVDIVDIEKTEDFIYVIMDHVEGTSLADVVRREGPQSEEDVQKWMLQVCDALGYLHRQDPPIVYRDMKPSNIMLHPDGYIKLIDLGVAREYKDEARKDTIAFGTTGYAAPEQYGKAQTDARTDIYGIGATMWHLLVGEAPPVEFPLPNVHTKNENVGEGFADVIIPKCCELERARRYQDCDELAADLEIYKELTREFRDKQARKVKTFFGCIIACVVCLVVGIGSMALRESTITEKFDYQMKLGRDQTQSAPEKAEKAYLAAIGYRPGDVEGYEGLIDAYKADGSFTTKEKAQLDDVYQQNLTELEKSSRFSELSYEMGRLYWYFYSYGGSKDDEDANRTTRIKASAEYFKNAAEDPSFENHDKAKIYNGIAQFTTKIAIAVKTDDDSDSMYKEYWGNLEDLADEIASESNETVRLDSYALISNAMETYMDKFKAAGIKKSQAEKLYKKVDAGLKAVSPKDDAAEQRRDETIQRLENEVQRKITTVYSNAVVAED